MRKEGPHHAHFTLLGSHDDLRFEILALERVKSQTIFRRYTHDSRAGPTHDFSNDLYACARNDAVIEELLKFG